MTNTAASLYIKDAPEMTKEARKDIARWLRRQANFLTNHGDELSNTYRARYIYAEEV